MVLYHSCPQCCSSGLLLFTYFLSHEKAHLAFSQLSLFNPISLFIWSLDEPLDLQRALLRGEITGNIVKNLATCVCVCVCLLHISSSRQSKTVILLSRNRHGDCRGRFPMEREGRKACTSLEWSTHIVQLYFSWLFTFARTQKCLLGYISGYKMSPLK